MKSVLRRRRRAAAGEYPARIRWLARLALVTLTLQLASLGHWSLGPFHLGPEGLETHSAHCHGDSSACGGQPSFTGTYIDRPLVLSMPAAALELTRDASPAPPEIVPAALERPPQLS